MPNEMPPSHYSSRGRPPARIRRFLGLLSVPYFLVPVLWILLVTESAVPVAGQNLLLVGNSYTRFNNLAGMLRSMLSELYGANTPVRVDQFAPNGATLQDHVGSTTGNTNLRRWLVTQPVSWTWVVLQEQSQVGGLHEFINFFFSVEAAKTLNDLIRETGAETVFFQTWGRRDGDTTMSTIYPDFLTMNGKLRVGYTRYVTETSTRNRRTRRAPVGDAFESLFRSTATTDFSFRSLYRPDGSHPSTAGSYLSACVIFSTITQRDPRQLKYVPQGLSSEAAVQLRAVAHRVLTARPHRMRLTGW